MQYKICDGVSACHNCDIIAEDMNAARVYCRECKSQYVIRKDHRGVPLNRQYAEIFKRDILQSNSNLLYKYHPNFLKH
jgi:hypothetical protein